MQYNQPFKVQAWLINKLPTEKADAVNEAFKTHGAFISDWIGDSFPETIREMEKQGWFEYVKPYPFIVNSRFLENVMSTHLHKSMSMVDLRPKMQYELAIKRNVESDADLIRVFNDALGLEDDLSLSFIFDTGHPKAKTYITGKTTDQKIVARLAEKVLTIGMKGCDINCTGKSLEDLPQYVMEEAVKLLHI